jgi:hypothetical protein
VSDDAFYRPNHQIPPRQPTPGESLWIVRREGVRWSCELFFRGESYGWEAQILRNGELVIARRFDLRRLAEQWGEEERKALGSGR